VVPLNYFAHYYFDHIQQSEIHNFGLALPDFVRNFIKGKRLKPMESIVFQKEELQLLHQGTLKHIQRDARFHNSHFFKDATKKMGKTIGPAFVEAGIPRAWWGSHLLTEMMLDRVLIKENPLLTNQFYMDLENTNKLVVESYINQFGIDESTDFFKRLDRFNQLRYLIRYKENDAIVFSLGRVYLYAGVSEEWTNEQITPLIPLMDEAENEISNLLNNLKEEMV
jgi:hypothetical protein